MMELTRCLAMCGTHMPRSYNLWSTVLGAGPMGLLGWIWLALIPLSAVVTIIRHAVCRSKLRRTHFYAVAHVCLLAFLHLAIVGGSFWDHPSQSLISLCIGVLTALISTVAVIAFTRIKPLPHLWSCFGFICILADLALFWGVLLLIIHLEVAA